jgi:alkyl hydroperoxide reductase subunit D
MSLAQTAAPAVENLEALKGLLPDFAKDIRLNLSNVIKADEASGLTQNQVLGIALASAYAAKHPAVVAAVQGEAASLSAEEVTAAKAAATIMAMNNVYYRSAHYANDEEIVKLPAGLRMMVIGNPGIDKITFELYALAVSAINGCGACVASHTNSVLQHNLPKIAVQHVFRIAAVITAAAQALTI